MGNHAVEGPGPEGNSPPGADETVVQGGAPYTIIRSLARGGLGEVFIAKDSPFERQVALKEIRREIAADPIRRERFLREAQVTGRLEHPGIVPVYGMGTLADGRAFYAMRLIRGETLEVAIRRFHGQTAPDYSGLEFRLLLGRFVYVCNTMAYVHGQGLIHRDLKPTNVMLGDFGETLVVDWGVAKPIGGADSTEEESQVSELEGPSHSPGRSITIEGQAVGTPSYMSPEQASGRGREVGPASDVYGLGATLYAMLAGRPPLEGVGDEVLQKVRQGMFPGPRQIRPGVPQALAAICSKAMALLPEHRYLSALELAGDIERWLADRPVSALPEPWSERARRWMRRNQTLVSGLVAAVTVSFLSLAIAVPLLSYAWRNEALARQREQMQRAIAVENEQQASGERDQAEAALKFLVDAFRKPDPAADGRALKVVDLLSRAARELEGTFADSPLTKARLLQAIGETFAGLGLPQESLVAFRRVAELTRETLGEAHPKTLAAMSHLAAALQDAGRIDEAVSLYESMLVRRREAFGEKHPDTFEAMNDLAVAYSEAGESAKAIPLYEKVLEQERTTLGENHPDTLTVMDNLAVAYGAAGQPGKAIPLHEAVLSVSRKQLGDEHPSTLITMNNLARAFRASGRHEEAIALYETALGKSRVKLGDDHPHTLVLLNGLAETCHAAGQNGRAIQLYEAVLTGRRRKLGEDHPDTIKTACSLARVYFAASQPEKAVPLAEEFLGIAETIEGHLPVPVRNEAREAAQFLVKHLKSVGRDAEARGYLRFLGRDERRDRETVLNAIKPRIKARYERT